jgi:replication-associated recombination protein RarA
MDTFKERYRPAHLAEIHGQREVMDQLKILARAPRPCCLLFVGNTGVGKSTAAEAFARELGCYDDWREWAYSICAADLDPDALRHWFGPSSPFRFRAGGRGFHVLIIEELEYCSKQAAVLLKDALERKVSAMGNVIVIATSNDTKGIPRAVLDRFKRFDFDSGLGLAQAVQQWLPTLWQQETARGVPLPDDWHTWGWDFEAEEFSARRAVDALEEAVRMRTVEAVRRVGA